MSKKILLSVSIFFLIFFILMGCTKKPPTKIITNQAPETYIVNVPPDSSYIYHARIIYWYGTDVDGIVTRYDWAVDDTIYRENIPNSGWHSLYIDSTLATQDTIAFEAPLPDTIYTHIFYVRAVDNKDKADPTPEHRVFRTSNILPNTRFLSTPKDNSQRFILSNSTDTWKGINFEWTAIDSDEVFPCQFQYCWDDTTINFDPVTHKGWSDPVSEESFYFTGENAPFDEDYHTLYIRAFDDAGGFDQSLSDTTLSILVADTFYAPDSTIDSIVIVEMDTTIYNQWRTLYFVIPEIGEDSTYRNVLWVNFASGWANSNVVQPFYHSILDSSIGLVYTCFDTLLAECNYLLCNHIKFSEYSTVIWSRGDKSSYSTALADNVELISDFLSVGGRIIFTGSGILNTGGYAPNETYGITKPFPFTDLHINKYDVIPAGSPSDTNIAPAETDTAFFSEDDNLPFLSLNESILWYFIRNNFLVEVMELDLWGEYNGELDILYTVNHYRDNADFERKPCATRFTYGDDENAMPSFFYFGFPLSYLEYGRAEQLLRAILTELDEIP